MKKEGPWDTGCEIRVGVFWKSLDQLIDCGPWVLSRGCVKVSSINFVLYPEKLYHREKTVAYFTSLKKA